MAHPKIEEANKFLKIADHMVYITFPAMKEQRLLIKILEQIHKAQKAMISFILDNEYQGKRIRLYAEPQVNFKTFLSCAPKYGIKEPHLDSIKKTASIIDMHIKSPMEFVKQDKLVIMSEGMQMESITHEQVKKHLIQSREMLKSIENQIKSEI